MNRKLGRGLDTLLGASDPQKNQPATVASPRDMAIEQLRPGKGQPRRQFDETELNRLAESIRQQGIIQPIIARPVGNTWEIVAGERRWRAAQLAGMSSVPVITRDLSDKEALIFALVENIQRANLNSVEQARGIKQLIDKLNITHNEAADNVGLSRPAVSNLLRLLSLSPPVLKMLQDKKLAAGHARALLSLSPAQQLAAAQIIANGDLSARAAEKLARRILHPPDKPPQDADTRNLEKELSQHLSTRVAISHKKNGGGVLSIRYGSLKTLDAILLKLKK